jgi:membrane-associated protein
MEWLSKAFDWFMHLDKVLPQVASDYGAWTYGILFAIVFCETGLVVTPFLPGDSLLFAAGAVPAAPGSNLSVWWMILILIIAAVLGDTVNYQIGHFVGPKVFREGRKSRWLKKKHLDRTHAFFEKYGGKTIIIARFVPIIRTFAPFVAGVGAMTYPRFLLYNIVGAVLWVTSLVLAGYWFGRLEFVQKNFKYVILGIIFVSLLPIMIEYWRARRQSRQEASAAATPSAEEGRP